MSKIEIMQAQGFVVLRLKQAELVILPQHVDALKQMKQKPAFAEYFTQQALVNRPARKLFQSWLKKESGLWSQIYATIHDDSNIAVPAEGGETGT
ncbi:MAG: hypothetical protein KA436_00610 [Oligoflexales bacterium]|nr:hypothetical protein [Oligoflexales bacterium]